MPKIEEKALMLLRAAVRDTKTKSIKTGKGKRKRKKGSESNDNTRIKRGISTTITEAN